MLKFQKFVIVTQSIIEWSDHFIQRCDEMERLKGIVMIITGAILWGATGPMLEWILENSKMSVPFILIIRLFIAGSALLIYIRLKGTDIIKPLRQKVWLRQMIAFGIFGMLGVQFSFLASIESSNAVIATLFQFMAPIYIIIFVSWQQRAMPPRAQALGIVLTIVGLFFLLTNGSLSGFALSSEALFWGAVIGLTFAFYTLYPVSLMHEWGVFLVIGWGMLFGGITLFVFQFMTFIQEFRYVLEWEVALMLMLVIVVGTLAFVLFLGSMKYISPIETSVLSSFEPLTAIVISVILFGQVLGMWQLAGAIGMLVGVTWMSIAGGKANLANEEQIDV